MAEIEPTWLNMIVLFQKELTVTVPHVMLGDVLRKIADLHHSDYGALFDLLEKLTSSDSKVWKSRLAKFLRKEQCWNGALLELLATTEVKTGTSRRLGENTFIVFSGGPNSGTEVQIEHCGGCPIPTVLHRVLGVGGVEDLLANQVLQSHSLQDHASDDAIIKQLGGEKEARISATEMLALISRQKNGELGILATDGNVRNIFYVENKANARFGELLWVSAFWHEGRVWRMDLGFADNTMRDWPFGTQVIARKRKVDNSTRQ